MIDVSSLTDFQAKIALLIERSGNIGRKQLAILTEKTRNNGKFRLFRFCCKDFIIRRI